MQPPIPLSVHAASGHRPAELNRRFRAVDGLRAVAACCVMAFHFGPAGGFADTFARAVPSPAWAVARHLDAGVQVFFVLSGFVIAYSVRDEPVTGRYVAKFAARRWLRLDPPYLLTIGLTLAVGAAADRVAGGGPRQPLPTVGDVVANMLYLPGILHRPYVSTAFWTLCLEVQFYLLFVGLLAVARAVAGRAGTTTGRVAGVAFAGLGLLSLGTVAGWYGPWDGWFIYQWYLFLLGAVVWWVAGRRLHAAWLAGYGVLIVAAATCRGSDPRPFVGLATAAVVLWATRSAWPDRLLGGRVFQFLGAISYSLYLLHGLVGPRTINLGRRAFGDRLPGGLASVAVAVGLSVAVAWAMHRYVERPGIRLGKRIKMRQEYAAAAAHVV